MTDIHEDINLTRNEKDVFPVEFNNFINKYTLFFNDFDEIKFNRDDLIHLYSGIVKYGNVLEDYSNELFPVFMELLQEANYVFIKIPSTLFYKLIVNDIIVFSCIITSYFIHLPHKPYSLYPYTSIVSRYSISPLSPTMAIKTIESLLSHLRNKKGMDPLINHIDPLEYIDYRLDQDKYTSIPYALLNLYLINFTPSFKEVILKDPLFNSIKSSKYLHLWMFACSNADEQYYLNSCNVAATLNALFTIHPNISTLIVFSDIVTSYLENKIKHMNKSIKAYPSLIGNIFVPTAKEFSSNILQSFKKSIKSLRNTCHDIIKSEHSLNISKDDNELEYILKLHSLIQEWNKEMQQLSSIFIPEEPIILTSKILKDRWHWSSRIMLIYSLIAQFIPTIPTFLSRSYSSRGITDVPHDHLHLDLYTYVDDCFELEDICNNIREEKTKNGDYLMLVEELWDLMILKRGIYVESSELLYYCWKIYHLSSCIPIKMEKNGKIERAFLLSDSEIRHFKILTMEQMAVFLCS